MSNRRPVVTFDLFSALLDSRTGGAAAFDRIGSGRGWGAAGTAVYDRWDTLNKSAQREASLHAPATWVSYRELAGRALATTYAELGLPGDARADTAALLESVAEWPLWPDVGEALGVLAHEHRVGLLSNVDDDIARSTRAAALVDLDVALTSQRLRAYKPSARIYTEARMVLGDLGGPGGMVHVAASARDVRGAVEAGMPVVRLRRPGHVLDPEGPRPAYEARSAGELARMVPQAAAAESSSP